MVFIFVAFGNQIFSFEDKVINIITIFDVFMQIIRKSKNYLFQID